MSDDEAAPAQADKPEKKPTITMKVLSARVQKIVGGKPLAVRAMVEAVVREIGESLKASENMRLPGLGITRVLNPKDVDTGKALRVAIRPMKPREPKGDRPAGAAKAGGAGAKAAGAGPKVGAKTGAKAGAGKAGAGKAAKAKQALAAPPEAD